MRSSAKRGPAAAGTVLVASVASVTTGILTQHWAIAWWVATGVLVVIGAGLQWWLTVTDSSEDLHSQEINRAAVKGSLRQSMRHSGKQSVKRSNVAGDLTQIQGADGD